MENKSVNTEDQKVSAAGQVDIPAEKIYTGESTLKSADDELGKIKVSGVVRSSQEKEGIEQAVRSCEGVSDIENLIQVSP